MDEWNGEKHEVSSQHSNLICSLKFNYLLTIFLADKYTKIEVTSKNSKFKTFKFFKARVYSCK